MEPLTQKFIRKLHEILMTGTVDAYRQQVRPGEYRTVTSRPRDRELLQLQVAGRFFAPVPYQEGFDDEDE